MLRLTPSEGQSVRHVAQAAGNRENDVRWLMQQIYRKQGLSSQVSPVRRVLAMDALPRR